MSFAQFDSTARKGYCYWQVPLTSVTLTLWTWFVPLAEAARVRQGEFRRQRREDLRQKQHAARLN